MIKICKHCNIEFSTNSPKAMYCQKIDECIEARLKYIKERDRLIWVRYRDDPNREQDKKGFILRHCRFCDKDFWGKTNQVYCRKTQDCLRASWVFYQKRRKDLNRGYNKVNKNDIKPDKKNKCSICGKPTINRWYCPRHLSILSRHYVEPQATQYDMVRGTPFQ